LTGFADALFGKRSPIDALPERVESPSRLQAAGAGSEAAPGAEEVGSRASEPVEAADRGGSRSAATPPPPGPMDDNSLESGE
jgi:hypothetical protein